MEAPDQCIPSTVQIHGTLHLELALYTGGRFAFTMGLLQMLGNCKPQSSPLPLIHGNEKNGRSVNKPAIAFGGSQRS
eukprot:scaffold155646_cov32-Prasinocladus_malaysianus.AAC.1